MKRAPAKGQRKSPPLRLLPEYQPKTGLTAEEAKQLRELLRPFIEADKKRKEERRQTDEGDLPPAA